MYTTNITADKLRETTCDDCGTYMETPIIVMGCVAPFKIEWKTKPCDACKRVLTIIINT